MSSISLRRRVALVCLNPPTHGSDEGLVPEMPNFGVRRVQAALVADRELGAEVFVVEHNAPDVDHYVERIEALDVDFVGFTSYLWSFPTFFEVARRLKRARPERTVVFGGPSARPDMMRLEPYADAVDFVDAIAVREGEGVIRDLIALEARSPHDLATVAGLFVPRDGAWHATGRRQNVVSLDELASPFQLGLMPEGTMGYLETYRGCPFSCKFCEWGLRDWDGIGRFHEVDAVVRELTAIARYAPPGLFLLDAGLNLNARAFRLLAEANDRIDFFRDVDLIAEVYPSHVTDEHLRFLEKTRATHAGVGLQSRNPDVLDAMGRPFNASRFEQVIRDLTTVATVELQIILGLPTDTPSTFRETLEFARSLPCHVRVYHCLVLPDALMSRGDASFEMRYDPRTLRMISCRGWTEDALLAECERLTALARAAGGYADALWWHFPSPRHGETRGTQRTRSSHRHEHEVRESPTRARLPVVS